MSWKNILKNIPISEQGKWTKENSMLSLEEVGDKELMAVGWIKKPSGKKVTVYDNMGFDAPFPFVIKEEWDLE